MQRLSSKTCVVTGAARGIGRAIAARFHREGATVTDIDEGAGAAADGPVWGNNRHLPGDEVWLVSEWRTSGERKFYLTNLPPHTTRRVLAGTIKARWVCEQAHQQLKEELGLDHFEGRSWTGLHRHALMTCIACAYLQHLRLAQPERADRGEKGGWPTGTTAISEPARHAAGHHRTVVRQPHPARAMPTLSKTLPAAL